MKRFLDKQIVTAENVLEDIGKGISDFGKAAMGDGYLTPILKPMTPEGQEAKEISGLTPKQQSEVIDTAEKTLLKLISNENDTLSIYKSHGLDKSDYDSDAEKAYKEYSIPKMQYNQFIIGLWPLMQDKNFTFAAFLELFDKVASRFRNTDRIDKFFKSFLSVLPDLSKTIGLSDSIIKQAIDFLLEGKSAEDFQQYLLYQMILKYSLFGEIPENKQKDISKATETLEQLKRDVNVEEQELFDYLHIKAQFLKENEEVYKQVTFALLDMRKDNFLNLIGLMRNGINENDIKFYFRNLKYGDFFNLLRTTQPFSASPQPEMPAGREIKSFSDKNFRKIFASADVRKDIDEAANATYRPSTAPSPAPESESTPESTVYGKFVAQINQFEITVSTLVKQADVQISYILNKQSSSPQIGPFSAGNVFTYLQDEDESLRETDRIVSELDDLIAIALNLRNDLIREINETKISAFEEKQRNLAKTALNEKFDIFKKDMRSKQLGLKFNKVLISRQNEYSETEDLYNNLKIDMENNVSARPIIAPKAVLAGFRMADILEEIAEEFKNIAGNNPLRAEQAMKTARRWENFAKQQRATVFTEIYPGMAQSIGIEATKPTISPSFSLKGAGVNILKNLRFAGKFMDKEVESDKRFRDYWNSLFMQSQDPRPMGDIIEEKPKHGNLTTEEDAKLHKDTMKRFKKQIHKKSRFKNKD